MEYGKVKQEINNIVDDNIKRLAKLFPSAVKDGEVDFEALKEELGQFTEVGPEKYELTWAGKKEAKKIAQEDVIGKTLKYIPEDSKDADTTENLYIEGDNLEVLKLLRQNYYGAIKMIYIDPPYNTGNDFVYNDNYYMSANESLVVDGNIDEYGVKYTINNKSMNRYHANWINMMYTRIKVAKDLLTDDGIMFISIDENEIVNVRGVCNEIFGEENFVACIVWQKIHSVKNDAKYLSENHEYALIYAKNINEVSFNLLPRTEEMNQRYKNIDDDERGPWQSGDLVASGERSNGHFMVVSPKTGKQFDVPQGKHWVYSQENLLKMVEENRIWFGKDGNAFPRKKRFLTEVQDGRTPSTLWLSDEVGHNQTATRELKELFDNNKYFDFPKPVDYIKQMLIIGTDKDSKILDFFSGSATTANAVMQLNNEDNGQRKFIMVQLPEETEREGVAFKSGFKNICDIGRARIDKAGEKIIQENSSVDVGFKTFRTGRTNIKWNSLITEGELDVTQIELTPDLADFMPGSSDVDVVYELILQITEDGKLSSVKVATTLSEVEERTKKLVCELQKRMIHKDVIKCCKEEFLQENYFHAVQEATKSLAEKVREKTGLQELYLE